MLPDRTASSIQREIEQRAARPAALLPGTRREEEGCCTRSNCSGRGDRHSSSHSPPLHFVVADRISKCPIAPGWLKVPATAIEVQAALADPGLLVGHVPCRVGLLAVDVDAGGDFPVDYWCDAVQESLGPAACMVRTGSGGVHLYYRTNEAVGNIKWEGGEIRGDAGYVVLWNNEALLVLLENIEDHDFVDCTQWPLRRTPVDLSDWRPADPQPGQTAKVLAALKAIPCPELHYDYWIAIGMALHCAEVEGCIENGLTIWRDWSATDPGRFRRGECEAKWRGFDAGKGRSLGTLFWIARQYGFRVAGRRRLDTAEMPAHPHLNERQLMSHTMYYARARAAHRKGGGMKASIENRILARHHNCCRKTIERDDASMVDAGYLKPAGKHIVRTERGGYVLPAYRPTTPELMRWEQHIVEKAETEPEPVGGCILDLFDEGVADISTPIPGVESLSVGVRRGEPP